MTDLYLNETQVRDILSAVGKNDPDEVIVVRCIRKTAASKPGGPDVGDLYDLHCTKKPEDYIRKTATDRRGEDASNGVLTVYVTNRRGDEGAPGAWRRVNVAQVQKVIMPDGTEYQVQAS